MAKWRRKISEFEADLYKVKEEEPSTLLGKLAGIFKTHNGEIEIENYEDGSKEMEIEFFGVDAPDGASLSVVVDGTAVCQINAHRGRAKLLLDTSQGDSIPEVQSGSMAEIHHAGQVVLEGTFKRD